jgi:hypothetical protein
VESKLQRMSFDHAAAHSTYTFLGTLTWGSTTLATAGGRKRCFDATDSAVCAGKATFSEGEASFRSGYINLLDERTGVHELKLIETQRR